MILVPSATIASAAPIADDTTCVCPPDTSAVLHNPGMGWVLHFYDNDIEAYGSQLALTDTLSDFPGLTTIYLRLPWAYLEPEEGEFRWSILDAPLQKWRASGRQVAFRFTCCETGFRFATPEWVQRAGARGHDFRPHWCDPTDGFCWEPDYDDPVFLDKLEAFLSAAGARYDGSPEVAFVDVGSFGVWGEGHTSSSTRLPYSAATVKTHIDLHRQAFPRTLLAANDDFAAHGRGMDGIHYARAQGLTLRDDSILVEPGDRAYHNALMAQEFWPIRPVILESQHYGHAVADGAWGDGFGYLRAMEEYHASYASIHWWPREFLRENHELIARMNQRLGYRLQLTEARWSTCVSTGDRLEFRALWHNAGVAPCLPGGFPAVSLRDAQGGIAAVLVDEKFDVASLPPSLPGDTDVRAQKSAWRLSPFLPPGDYELCVSVGDRVGTPRIALPLPEGDAHRRYRLGTVRVQG